MFKEFKEFAVRGNVIDMAVGVIVGAAFGKIVTSLVEDIVMPPISLLTGKMDFSNRFLSLTGRHFETLAEAKSAGAATLNYGLFFNALLNFFLVAFAIFLVVRQVNRLRRGNAPPPATPSNKECPFCFSSIPTKATRCGHCTSTLTPASSS